MQVCSLLCGWAEWLFDCCFLVSLLLIVLFLLVLCFWFFV